jgi:hypothetical protein
MGQAVKSIHFSGCLVFCAKRTFRRLQPRAKFRLYSASCGRVRTHVSLGIM